MARYDYKDVIGKVASGTETENRVGNRGREGQGEGVLTNNRGEKIIPVFIFIFTLMENTGYLD